MEEQITLDTPIKRGDTTIEQVTLRKPDSGALRGTSLVNVMQMDFDTLCTVVPRISEPALTKQEIIKMDPADLLQLGTAVSGFLLPKAHRAEPSPSSSKTPSPTLQ